MLNFLKNLFSGAATETAEPEAAILNTTSHPNPQYDNLTGQLFKQELKDNPNAVLLDVRTPMEVRAGALPKAINIDIMSSNFTKQIAALDKSKTYLVYCRSGNRSAQACKIMYKMGFDVRNLLGGIGAFPK